MASALPAKLNVPAIAPFARRAAQLEKYKPIASYWCNYYVVNQILAKGLHTADDECMLYTTTLMDRLEQVKNEAPANDAILDDVAAKAYMEQFAVETFQRGDDAIHTNKASKQTIDTFQAASTFLELLSTWSPLEPEVVAKIKYAKYHALRIAKAIKAGEDPNASNPVDEQSAEPGMDGIESGEPAEASGSAYHPPTVESAPDSMQPSRSASVPQTGSIAPPPLDTPFAAGSSTKNEHDVSPVESVGSANRNGSIGGGYFPSVPTFTSEASAPFMPTAQPDLPSVDAMDQAPDAFIKPEREIRDDVLTPSDYYTQQPSVPPSHVTALPGMSSAASARGSENAAPLAQNTSKGPYRNDDDSILLAQKHAKWAMSALNFEDVETAVKELKLALQTLGAF